MIIEITIQQITGAIGQKLVAVRAMDYAEPGRKICVYVTNSNQIVSNLIHSIIPATRDGDHRDDCYGQTGNDSKH